MTTINDLPRHNKMPVPYVVPWTDEVKAQELRPIKVNDTFGHRLDFAPEVSLTGTPLLSSISTRRQYDCMINGKCQICGEVINGPAKWIVHPHAFIRTPDNTLVTADPPLCEPCVMPSLAHCPYLRENRLPQVLTVDTYSIWGAEVQYISPTTGNAEQVLAVPYAGRDRRDDIAYRSLLAIRLIAVLPEPSGKVPATQLTTWNDQHKGFIFGM